MTLEYTDENGQAKTVKISQSKIASIGHHNGLIYVEVRTADKNRNILYRGKEAVQ